MSTGQRKRRAANGADGEVTNAKAIQSKRAKKNKKNKKVSKRAQKKQSSEAALEALLFGDEAQSQIIGNESTHLQNAANGVDHTEASVIGGTSAIADFDVSGDASDEVADTKVEKPAWEDQDDEAVMVDISSVNRLRKLRTKEDEKVISGAEYSKRLRSRFDEMSSSTAWAKRTNDGDEADSDDDEDEAEAGSEFDILRSTGGLFDRTSGIPAKKISMTRLKDANVQAPSKSVVRSTRFHHSGQLLMTAGMDKTVRLFQIDGVQNPKAQGVYFEDLPIVSAEFCGDGNEIIVSGRRKYFYSYDMISGKSTKVPYIRGRPEKSLEKFTVSPTGDMLAFCGLSGSINLVSAKTKQWVGALKMNGMFGWGGVGGGEEIRTGRAFKLTRFD
jgi:U3 small nucleolar RNA-associated protein 18